MGALEEMEFRLTGWDCHSPDHLDAHLESAVLPEKYLRAGKAISAQWRTKLANDFTTRLVADTNAISAQWTKTEAVLNDGIRRTIDVKKAVATGRMSRADGLREVTRLVRQREQVLQVQAAMQRSVEQWNRLSESAAEEYLAARRERFSSVPRTVRITGAMLAGEADSPFTKAGE